MDEIAARIAAEAQNTTQIVEALLRAGYEITVDHGENVTVGPSAELSTIVDALHACDEETLIATRGGQAAGFVSFVYGNAANGSEVVADISESLEELLAPIIGRWG